MLGYRDRGAKTARVAVWAMSVRSAVAMMPRMGVGTGGREERRRGGRATFFGVLFFSFGGAGGVFWGVMFPLCRSGNRRRGMGDIRVVAGVVL